MAQRELPEALVKGAVVAGKYRIDKILGVGGMAAVAGATHTLLDEKVALKCLLPQLADDPDLVERFLREAKASIVLRSEHVVRVHDVGTLESGEPFIVMELLEGRDLDRLSRAGRLPDADIVSCMVQAAEALAEAHGRGIIHRDVKPANLFAIRGETGERIIKVLDFGISRIRNEVALTSVGHVVGSVHYMSPEQLAGARDLDGRADVYSLALTAYELLTGQRAYQGGSVLDVSKAVLETDPPPLATARPDLPAGLADIVTRGMAKVRNQRPASMVAFALELAPFASNDADSAIAKLKRRAAHDEQSKKEAAAAAPASAAAFGPQPAATTPEPAAPPEPAPSPEPEPSPSPVEPTPATERRPTPAPAAPPSQSDPPRVAVVDAPSRPPAAPVEAAVAEDTPRRRWPVYAVIAAAVAIGASIAVFADSFVEATPATSASAVGTSDPMRNRVETPPAPAVLPTAAPTTTAAASASSPSGSSATPPVASAPVAPTTTAPPATPATTLSPTGSARPPSTTLPPRGTNIPLPPPTTTPVPPTAIVTAPPTALPPRTAAPPPPTAAPYDPGGL